MHIWTWIHSTIESEEFQSFNVLFTKIKKNRPLVGSLNFKFIPSHLYFCEIHWISHIEKCWIAKLLKPCDWTTREHTIPNDVWFVDVTNVESNDQIIIRFSFYDQKISFYCHLYRVCARARGCVNTFFGIAFIVRVKCNTIPCKLI